GANSHGGFSQRPWTSGGHVLLVTWANSRAFVLSPALDFQSDEDALWVYQKESRMLVLLGAERATCARSGNPHGLDDGKLPAQLGRQASLHGKLAEFGRI